MPTGYDVKLRCNIVEYRKVFLYFDWLLVYWRIFADIITYIFLFYKHTTLHREGITLDTN